MAPTKQKALLLEYKQGPFTVSEIDVPRPGPGEILVKTISAGLNPADWKVQAYGLFYETFPAIVGSDGAGIVEELGEGVTEFEVGDKIFTEGTYDTVHATFQQYFVAVADVSAKVPSNVSLDEAASVPSGLVTAAVGLFNEETPNTSAALSPPWEEGGQGKYAGKALVIFGGATSIGQFVIQLGKLAGFSPIIATASLHNTDLLKSLGATHIVDRNLAGPELISAVKKITTDPIELVYDTVSYADTQNMGYDLLATGGVILITLKNAVDPVKQTETKKIAHVFGLTHAPSNRKLGQSLFARLTELLEKGLIKPNRVEALPDGLAGIQGGLERLKKNQVSGCKLIAHPQETA